jgi:hypothetical protein
MLYKATAALPRGLKLIIKVSTLHNKFVPINVKVVYLPKCSSSLFVSLAFLMKSMPSHPRIILIIDVAALTIIKQ